MHLPQIQAGDARMCGRPLAVLRIYTGRKGHKGTKRGRRREMATQPRHRPVQRFPDARRQILACPFVM